MNESASLSVALLISVYSGNDARYSHAPVFISKVSRNVLRTSCRLGTEHSANSAVRASRLVYTKICIGSNFVPPLQKQFQCRTTFQPC